MATLTTLYFSGDHLAVSPFQPTNVNNPGDPGFGMSVQDASAVGTSSDVYRIVWYQNTNTTDTSFRNGQMWVIQKYDPAQDPDGDPLTGESGWPASLASNEYGPLIPKNDLVAGMGTGDDYIVLEHQGPGGGHLVLDMTRSFAPEPTDYFYAGPPRGSLTFSEVTYTPPPPLCFAAGTLIDTPDGPRAVESLAVGDLVITRDAGPMPIRWIGRRHIADLGRAPARLRPVLVAPGALGPGMPARPLRLSPQHRVLLRSRIARRMFDTDQILVAVRQLVGMPGIAIDDAADAVTYLHILLDDHAIVTADGAAAETLLPGPMALRMLDPAARAEIAALFPETPDPGFAPRPARSCPPGAPARQLARRHLRNGLALFV